MKKPTIRIHNAETDEIIDREMTDAEFTEYQKDLTRAQAAQAEADIKAQTRQAVLDKLGLTADEVTALLG